MSANPMLPVLKVPGGGVEIMEQMVPGMEKNLSQGIFQSPVMLIRHLLRQSQFYELVSRSCTIYKSWYKTGPPLQVELPTLLWNQFTCAGKSLVRVLVGL